LLRSADEVAGLVSAIPRTWTNDMGRSHVRLLIGTELYRNLTIRNVNTVRKLHELLGVGQ